MNEVDLQLMARYGEDGYLQIASVRQCEFFWSVSGKCVFSSRPVVFGLTIIDGFEDSGVITNGEVRRLLTRNLMFLRSTKRCSSLFAVEYFPTHYEDRVGDVQPFMSRGSKKWHIQVYGNKHHLPDQKRADIIKTIGHEMGHIFWEDHLDQEHRQFWFDQCSSWTVPDDNSPEEWFCETVGDAVLNSDYMFKFTGRQMSPERRALEEIEGMLRLEMVSI